MASPLIALSVDTRNHVLGYLSLQSCLRYSEVSQQCLRELLPHMKHRRARQFCQRHAYRLLDPCRLFPVRDVAPKIDTQTISEAVLQPISGSKDQWHVLLTVAERIQALYRALPMSHSSCEILRQLLLDLQEEPILLSEQGFLASNFTTSLQELQLICKAHRLHEHILSDSTVSCNPPSADRGFGAHARGIGTSFTTTLDQYIGDILIVYFLMGHSVAGMVEGLTTHQRWVQHLLNPLDIAVDGPIHWYRLWVFMHSTLLRTFPMTREQLSDYKLPLCGILGRTEPENVEYIHPHYCYLGTGTSVVNETTIMVENLLHHQEEAFLEDSIERPIFVHSTRVDLFGSLGPFRGRDVVRSTIMEPRVLLDHLNHPAFGLPPTWILLEEGRHFISQNDRLVGWFSSADDAAIPDENLSAWIRYLPQKCYRSRPMTVQPPLVTMDILAIPG